MRRIPDWCGDLSTNWVLPGHKKWSKNDTDEAKIGDHRIWTGGWVLRCVSHEVYAHMPVYLC